MRQVTMTDKLKEIQPIEADPQMTQRLYLAGKKNSHAMSRVFRNELEQWNYFMLVELEVSSESHFLNTC